jgi:hypothetical protein
MSRVPAGRRAFAIACLIGGVMALLGFVLVLHVGPGGFFRRETFANFYDAQADSWLHGRWDVPAHDLYIEGFKIGSKTYTYFGAWPSLLRLPVLAVSGSAYGHLTGLSMTIALATALAGVALLQWRLRELFRPGRPFGRGELVLSGAVVFVAGCGTSLLFLASRAWVYHEAIIWGAALALVAYERVLAFMMRPTRARLIGASVLAALAFLSRASVGMGPLVALGLVLVGRILRSVHRASARRRAPRDVPDGGAGSRARGFLEHLDWLGGVVDGRTWIVPLLVAVVVPAAIYGYVNVARFGTPFSVPWTHQVLALINPRHQRVLAANGGTYFGLKFAPTTLLQYLRPDALAFDPHFPWITFPHFATPVIGTAKFDTLDPSTSVVASMPALTLLAIVGVIGAVVPRVGRTREAAWLRVPLLGALGGIGLTVAISYVAQRYLGDWVPLMLLGALIGIQVLWRRYEGAPRRRGARIWVVVVAVLALFGIWVNFGLAILYARLYAPQHDTDRLAMLEVQHSLDVGGPHSVGRSATLPVRPARAGTTWIVGDCDSMSWSDGRTWYPVQGTAAGGWFRLRVRPSDLSTDWQPLVTAGGAGDGIVVAVRRNPDRGSGGTIDIGLGRIGPDGDVTWPAHPTRLPFGPGAHRVNVLMDHALRFVRVTVDGTNAVLARDAQAPAIPPGPFRVDPRVQQLPDAIGLCRDLIGRGH